MSFVPPYYSKLGKGFKDLVSKQFNFCNNVKVINKASNGITVETQGKGSCSGSYCGSLKVKAAKTPLGKVEANACSGGNLNVQVESNSLIKGTKVTINGKSDLSGSLKVEYNQNSFAGDVTVNHNEATTTVVGNGVIGTEGLSVGGSFTFDAAKNEVVKYGAAAEYGQKDLTATLKADMAKTEKVSVMVHHKINGDTQVGACVCYDLSDYSSCMVGAVQHRVDADVVFKGKVNSKGKLSTSVEHILPNPAAKVNVAAQFDLNDLGNAEKLGFGFTFGDF